MPLDGTWSAALSAERAHTELPPHPRPAPSPCQTLGTLQQRAGDVDGAKASFSSSLSLRPHAPTYVAFALLEAAEGHVERARWALLECLESGRDCL